MIQHKRAIEALRSGVPNRDSVNALGSSQHRIVNAFEANLQKVRTQQVAGGMVFAGEFGSGKSHLLEFLQHRAEQERFVTSKVVISKETPLHDPGKVFRSAIANARVPGRRGAALTDIVDCLDRRSAEYAQFYEWVNSPRSGLNERFAATLYLMENLDDQEFHSRILGFWSGNVIGIGDLKRKLKECGETSSYNFSKALVRDLAIQRFRFVARLIKAAGFSGWTLLFDEVELIGRYSSLQRGRSYAELARWVRPGDADRIDGITSVAAITEDFAREVLVDKHDIDEVPNRLRAKGNPADEIAAVRAEVGMKLLRHESVTVLDPLTEEVIDAAHEKVRSVHSAAYNWEAPPVRDALRMTSRRMREYVRSWIYTWDLKRPDPAYTPAIRITPLNAIYSEDADLEGDAGPDTWEDAAE